MWLNRTSSAECDGRRLLGGTSPRRQESDRLANFRRASCSGSGQNLRQTACASTLFSTLPFFMPEAGLPVACLRPTDPQTRLLVQTSPS